MASEEFTQQGGHPLKEKYSWTLRNILFLAARENTDIYLWSWCQVTVWLAHAEQLSGLEKEEKESRYTTRLLAAFYYARLSVVAFLLTLHQFMWEGEEATAAATHNRNWKQ